MSKVRVAVVRAPGTNCDSETAYAFERAGAETHTVHVGRLIRHEIRLADYQVVVIPGGFSYGDDIGAGTILANELKVKLGGDLAEFVRRGGLILGICNGFQVLAKAGMLSGLSPQGLPLVTLTNNDSGRFECRWVYLVVNKTSRCVFTAGIERMYLPVAHGEGKVVGAPQASLDEVLWYADENGDISSGYPHNPNGSPNDVAGLCDASGRVFALMPHPERHVLGTQHPQWPRLGARESGDGFRIFQNAVDWAKSL